MKKLILITALLFIVKTQGQEVDKVHHTIGGGMFGTVGYFLGHDAFNGDRSSAIWTGIGVGVGVNVMKEITDIPSTGFSVEDVAFGALGAIVSTFVTDAIFQSEGSRKRREAKRIQEAKDKINKFYE